MDEYFEYLIVPHFPRIEHEELLLNKPPERKPKKKNMTFDKGFDIGRAKLIR